MCGGKYVGEIVRNGHARMNDHLVSEYQNRTKTDNTVMCRHGEGSHNSNKQQFESK